MCRLLETRLVDEGVGEVRGTRAAPSLAVGVGVGKYILPWLSPVLSPWLCKAEAEGGR